MNHLFLKPLPRCAERLLLRSPQTISSDSSSVVPTCLTPLRVSDTLLTRAANSRNTCCGRKCLPTSSAISTCALLSSFSGEMACWLFGVSCRGTALVSVTLTAPALPHPPTYRPMGRSQPFSTPSAKMKCDSLPVEVFALGDVPSQPQQDAEQARAT